MKVSFGRINYGMAMLIGSTSALLAQDVPSEAFVQDMLTAALPSFWTVNDFDVVATSRSGDAANPGAALRFEAKTLPAEPLFKEIGQEGPFTIVVETVSADTQRTLYGYADLTYSGGAWDGQVVLDNPVMELGQPKDFFIQPPLVSGSETAEARLNEIRTNDIGKITAAHRQEIERLEREHTEMVSDVEAGNEAELASLRRAHAEQLASLRAEANDLYRTAEADYAERLAQLTAEQAPLLAEAEAKRARLLAENQAATNAALAEVKQKAAAEMEQLRAEHAEARGQIVEEQRQELAALETRLASEKSSLEEQLATAQDVIELQEQLAAAMEERNKVGAEAFAAFETARQQRTEFFNSLPKKWVGQVRCVGEDFDATDPLFVWLNEPNAHGLMGWIGRSEDNYEEMTLVAADNSRGFPLKARLASDGGTDFGTRSNIRYTVDLEIAQDGRMEGEAELPVWYGSQNWNPTCNLRLSAAPPER